MRHYSESASYTVRGKAKEIWDERQGNETEQLFCPVQGKRDSLNLDCEITASPPAPCR
jgi:hypothetical protein